MEEEKKREDKEEEEEKLLLKGEKEENHLLKFVEKGGEENQSLKIDDHLLQGIEMKEKVDHHPQRILHPQKKKNMMMNLVPSLGGPKDDSQVQTALEDFHPQTPHQ